MRDIPAARAVAQELEREVLVLLIGRGGRVRLLVCGVPVGATLTLRDGAGVTALRLPIDATWPWSVDWPVALLFVASDFVVASLDPGDVTVLRVGAGDADCDVHVVLVRRRVGVRLLDLSRRRPREPRPR
jgi:hypothetical protein